MVEPLEQFRAALKQHGQSLTRSRQLVFSALQDKEPQTMHAVVQSCHAQVDRASVYRTIALFERLGIVQRLQIGWKYKLELSDAFHHHHHHLTCLQCARIIPLPEDPQLENRLRQLAKAAHFHTQDHQVEIRGLCHTCQNRA
jgi:Fur family ferric uptake transcriptional regulator